MNCYCFNFKATMIILVLSLLIVVTAIINHDKGAPKKRESPVTIGSQQLCPDPLFSSYWGNSIWRRSFRSGTAFIEWAAFEADEHGTVPQFFVMARSTFIRLSCEPGVTIETTKGAFIAGLIFQARLCADKWPEHAVEPFIRR